MSQIELWRGFGNPLRELSQLQRSMDRLFDTWAGPTTSREAVEFLPTCEVSETKNAFLFKFDLPGLSKDQIKIDIQENRLTVSGERREEKHSDDKAKHVSEVSYGSFMRSFTLPTNIDSERTEARYENGVLSVEIAKAESSKARQVSIK